MSRRIQNIFLYIILLCVSLNTAWAATVQLNSGGGSSSSNGLRVYIEDTTQIQVRRLDSTGQLYSPSDVPTSTRLDNGIYLRANNTIYGPDHFAFPNNFTPTAFINRSVTTPTPTTVSQGVTQSSTSTFRVANYNGLVTVAGPNVSVNWKYTYPLDYVTAEVTLTIPVGYPVSSTNPVRYYHAVDTYLGGSDFGCGVGYTDTNGKKVVGTYPYTGANNAACPSSTTLPANLDVVESFRERTGKFSHYCVGFYDSFWGYNTTENCDITKTSSLSDTFSSTKIDTGVAIEYDFTLPGIYTFSYDFVVGSTFVPAYDHLEIRHPGSSTLCPVEVQVLACLTSTVPCPSDQLVTSGSLKGSLAFSPTSPSVTATPDPFELGGAASIATVTMQGTAAATYTLSASGLTKTPLSGIKCWNTATNSQSCSFTMNSTPCVSTFECMESDGATYNSSARHPLNTKVLAKDFDVDVVALLANGAQSTGYTSLTGLTVDLVVESNNTCSTNLTDVVATKLVSFAASENGRKKVTFTATDALLGGYPRMAYPNLRCRVRDIGLGKSGCSSDNFAIRPQSFTVSTTNTSLASTPSSTSAYTLKAGTDSFNLKAVTGESGYSGTPSIDTTKVYQHDGVVTAGQVGYDTSNPNKFPAASSGVSSSDTFKYSEVGFFQFAAQGVYDDTFTAVDKANGDCDTGGFDNTGTGTPKRYGCNFGNTAASSYYGRFIPDKFVITTGSSTQACDTFVYYNQDTSTKAGLELPFTITAQNGSGVTTTYYAGSYAKFNNPSAWTNFNFATTPALVGATLGQSAFSPALQGSWSAGQAAMTARFNVNRPASPIAEQTFSVTTRVQDSDGVATNPATMTLSGATYRYGRIAMTPAHGSELLPLIVPVEAQYWSGGGYRRNTDDSCTSFPLNTIAMKNYRGNLNACETVMSVSSAMNHGIMNLRLSAPGVTGTTPNTGSVDLDLNYGSAAGDRTCVSSVQSNAADGTGGLGSWFGADPAARATFGVYKAPIIYMRENF